MTQAEIITMIEEMGIEYAYDHFAEGEAPDLPFICFLTPNDNNFGADNIVYFSSKELHIELYTEKKEPDTEAIVEEVLTNNEIYYDKSEVWIETEKMYEVLYSMIV